MRAIKDYNMHISLIAAGNKANQKYFI